MKITILSLLILVTCFSCSTDDNLITEELTQENKISEEIISENNTSMNRSGSITLPNYNIHFLLNGSLHTPITGALMQNNLSIQISYTSDGFIYNTDKEAVRVRYDKSFIDITDVIIIDSDTEIWIYAFVDPDTRNPIIIDPISIDIHTKSLRASVESDEDVECDDC